MFSSHRKFVLYSYTIGHGCLLLRSGISADHLTRVDILFRDVRLLDIVPWLEGVEITINPDLPLEKINKIDHLVGNGLKLYSIKTRNWDGLVAASGYWIKEDDKKFSDPSPFGAEFGAL